MKFMFISAFEKFAFRIWDLISRTNLFEGNELVINV